MFPSLHFSGKSLTIFESLGQCLALPSLLDSGAEMAVLLRLSFPRTYPKAVWFLIAVNLPPSSSSSQRQLRILR